MKNHFLLTLLAILSLNSTFATGFLVGFDQFNSLSPDSGYFDSDTSLDVYLMSGGDGFLSGPPVLLPDSIYIGTYQFTSSLGVSPFEVELGIIEPLITNGVDEYLTLYMEKQDLTVSISRLESVWFGTGSDLIGSGTLSATFAINELRSSSYGTDLNEREMIDYMDLGVTIIPESSNIAIISGLFVMLTICFVRRRGLGNESSH